jgi:hypothetical protein
MFVCVVHNYLQTFRTYLRIYKLTFHKQHMNECSHVNLLSHHNQKYNFRCYNVTNNKTLEDLNSMILTTTNKCTTQRFCYWIQYNQRRIYVSFGTLKVLCFHACRSTTYKTFHAHCWYHFFNFVMRFTFFALFLDKVIIVKKIQHFMKRLFSLLH